MRANCKHGTSKQMNRAFAAATLYFAATFAAGFALGTFRTLFLAPRVGEFVAVLIELPIMLAVAATYATAQAEIGLSAQLAYAAFPLVRNR